MKLAETGIIAICRKIYGEDLKFLAGALYRGGIRCIEVTFDQQDPDHEVLTSEAIRELKEAYPDMNIGAGTVINSEQLETAHKAGAEFIISPNTDTGLIRRTRELGMLSIPGAMTPSEIVDAYTEGASYVKIFPAGNLGTAYLKAVRGPINHIPMLAVGGIGTENLAEFLRAGCCGAGIGGSLYSKKLIAERNADALSRTAEELIRIYRQETGA